MSDGDYVLGTRDDEVARLGVQHSVWRAEMLEGFRLAGFGAGQTILDVGAGPGFASADLSELVGPSGRVIALERSPHFAATLRGRRCGSSGGPPSGPDPRPRAVPEAEGRCPARRRSRASF